MLRSLRIKNFRSLEDFAVPLLGRVNLIVGKNNSGKSTVLEAIRIYAGNANRNLLEKIAEEHDEKTKLDSAEGIFDDAPFEAFFSGRRFPVSDEHEIHIGKDDQDPGALKIRHGFLIELQTTVEEEGELVTRNVLRPIPRSQITDENSGEVHQSLFITKNDKSSRIRFDVANSRIRNTVSQLSETLPCSVVPTQFVSMEELAQEWDNIVLTEYETDVRKALRCIVPDFEDLAFVRDIGMDTLRRESKRYGKVRLGSINFPVPLNSMGDGVVRVLQLVLRAYTARGGFLLIDEFENGLHYSVQEKVWDLIFDIAERLNIQVFATTHSWDCIESFSKVAVEKSNIEGILFRVGKSVRLSDKGRVIGTVFSEDQLRTITQADMEVR